MNNDQDRLDKPIKPQYYHYPEFAYAPEDEINLLELWQILIKRKKAIVLIALAFLLAGAAYAFFAPAKYSYSTALKIGTYYVERTEKPIDTALNAASKLKELYMTTVLNDYYKENPAQAKNVAITVEIPKDSEILVISGKGTESEGPLYTDLVNKICAKLINEHGQKLDKYKKNLLSLKENAERRLASIEEQSKLIGERVDAYEAKLVNSKVDNVSNVLVFSEFSRQQAAIDSEKFTLQEQIAVQEEELKSSENTEHNYPVTQSVEPVGPKKISLLAAFTFLGLFLGILAAFILEFAENAKTKKQMGSPL